LAILITPKAVAKLLYLEKWRMGGNSLKRGILPGKGVLELPF